MNATNSRRNTLLALAFVPVFLACSSSDGGGPTGGPLDAAMDNHCQGTTVTVDPAACHPDAGMPAPDASMEPEEPDYGMTMAGQEGDDDDCKYHLKFMSTAIRRDTDVTFTVVVTHRADNSAVTGADALAEIFLNDTHPAPNSNVKTTENPPGTYAIGPVRFDAAGTWTVRFHLNDLCTDSEESPHGHGAFYIVVP